MKARDFFLAILCFLAEELLKFFFFRQPHSFQSNQGIALVFRNPGSFLEIFLFLLILVIYFSTIKTPEPRGNIVYLNIAFAGIFSNFIDRFILGYVIDYLNVSWPGLTVSFNMADIFILAGVLLYAYSFFGHIQRGTNPAR